MIKLFLESLLSYISISSDHFKQEFHKREKLKVLKLLLEMEFASWIILVL